MRATNHKHYRSECENTNIKANKKRRSFKAFSFIFAITLVATVLIIPTTTLAPNVNAFEDSRAASYSIGDIDEFSVAITNNCVQVTTTPITQELTTVAETTEYITTETTKPTEKPKKLDVEVPGKENTYYNEPTGSNIPTYNEIEVPEITEPAPTIKEEKVEDSVVLAEGFLIGISNPDPTYSPKKVTLSDADRAKLERLVMGEAGSMGYEGCALVAQAIRDAMNRSNTTSIDRIISEYKYYAPTNKEPNQTVKDAVSYIFDSNGSAVQHRVICFYTGTSKWHETQTFVVGCGNVRFFDLKN